MKNSNARWLIWILVFLLLLGISRLQAGDELLRFKHLTIDDGLPSNTIHSIIKDKYGFMWFATMNGLTRYDGYTFRTFRSNTGTAGKPVSNRPVSLALDTDSNLWISFFREPNLISKFNYTNETFSTFTTAEADKEIVKKLENNSPGNVTRLEADSFVMEIGNLNLIQTNRKTGEKFIYKTDPASEWSISDEFVLTMYRDNQDIVWIGTDKGGVNYAQLNSPVFDFTKFNTPSTSHFREHIIRTLLKDRNGNTWIGTRNDGLVKIDNSGLTTHYQHSDLPGTLSDNRIRRLLEDSRGTVWVGVKGGLCRYQPATKTFKTYNFDTDRTRNEDWVFSLFEDSRGNLWAGTWFGPALYNRETDSFDTFFNSDRKTLIRIRDIAEDKNQTIWIATEDNGLYKAKLIHTGKGRKMKAERIKNVNDSTHSLINNKLYCLSVDGNGKLWIGTENGLDILDPVTRKFSHFDSNPLLQERLILGLVCSDSSIWVSHELGVTQINYTTFHYREFRKNNDFLGVELADGAYFKDPNGLIYFGGNQGYFTINPLQTPSVPKLTSVVLTNLTISNKNVKVNQKLNNRILLQKPLYQTETIGLKWDERNIQIEFSAMYYSDPGSIRYAYRLRGLSDEWVYQDANTRKAVFQNLKSGKYTFEVKASNSNGEWSEITRLLVRIAPPWWLSWWALVLYFLFTFAVVMLTFRYFLDKHNYRQEIKNEKEKAEKFREIDELKTRLVTNISHEFRTPLTLILDPVEKLKQQLKSNENATYYLRIISKNSHKLLELVNQFLDIKKLESGNLKLNPEYRDFIRFIKSLTEYFEIHAKLHRINFSFLSSEEHVYMLFDPDKLDKAILNLLTNAFKHTPEGGTISLELNRMRDILHIVVSDTGEGIAEDQLHAIFEPFFQVNQGEKNSSGIGLTFAKELIELHNGSISVESSPGKGCRFTVTLPVALPENTDKQPLTVPYHSAHIPDVELMRSQLPVVTGDHSKPIVLVTEDNPDVREYIVSTLRNNYQVMEACNGAEGYSVSVEHIPDLILSDLMMPEMNGIDFCHKIKTDERTSHIPFILLSAQHNEEVIVSSYETGADAYITKPFSSNLLLIRVENMIETRKKLRQLFNRNLGYDTRIISANGIDKQFMSKITSLIYQHLQDTDFDVEALSGKMNLSRTQLYRKVKGMTDMSVKEFITTIKMNKAAELLISGSYSVGEVAELTGESELSNFSRNFTKQFGVSPGKYRNHYLKH